ncbi:PEP-CTERM sorting domain-containing protein [Anabaena sp. CCY 9402-a]|uniref:PEP-CTERM sorting domain-containing protein n=1 Tax=Anabaena sp. CCY 9402-a TaxID=3103867 RepID=UPI0039C6F3F8
MSLINKLLTIVISAGVTIGVGMKVEIATASSLIGDTIKYDYLIPDSSTVLASTTRLVQPGLADLINQTDGTSDTIFAVNPETEGFIVNFFKDSGFFPSLFNGFRLSSLDFHDSSILTGFILETNMVGLDANDSRISFTADTISVNLQGLSYDTNTYINVNLVTSVVSASVPEPSPVIGILAISGLGCLYLLKRKLIKVQDY